MSRLADIKADPGTYLGASGDLEADQECYELYYRAVEKLLAEDENLCEEDALEQVWANGDFVGRAQEILSE